MLKKTFILTLSLLLFAFIRISAQEVTSNLEYKIFVNSDLSADVQIQQVVFNNSIDKLITNFDINIPFKEVQIIEVSFNGYAITPTVTESDSDTQLSIDLGNSVIKSGESGTFKIRTLNKSIIKETNHIQYLKIAESSSNFPIATTKFEVDYSNSNLNTKIFITSHNSITDGRKVIVNDNELLIQWVTSGKYNIAFLENINAKNSDEGVLFNFINEDFYNTVNYLDVTEFDYGLKDKDNNNYGMVDLQKGQNSVGYIATLSAETEFVNFKDGNDLSGLVNLGIESFPKYNDSFSFETNLLNALNSFKSIPTSKLPEFQSVLSYYSSIQTPIDQCLFLNQLGTNWNFDVEILTGVMTYDYNILPSNQNIWCRLLYQDQIYSVDYYLENRTGYNFIVKGDFLDRLPLSRFNKESVNSFLIKYFDQLEITLSKNSQENIFETLNTDLLVNTVNEKNFSGEPVKLSINLDNKNSKFYEIDFIKVNDLEINLDSYKDYSFILVPLNKNEFLIEVTLEKDLFANSYKPYKTVVSLENSVIEYTSSIKLEIDFYTLLLNITLIVLVIILIIYSIIKYKNYRFIKTHFVKK